MSAFWHPLSTILLDDPRCFATAGIVRMLLASGAPLSLIYAGDRMWPAVSHGTRFASEPLGADAVEPGEVVLALRDGIPDLLRVSSVADDRVTLVADADPTISESVPREALLARATLPPGGATSQRSGWRRLRLDLREAWNGRPDENEDPAETVRDKYESQAAFYARDERFDLGPHLVRRILRHAPDKSRLLVVGSGTGRESFTLAEAGFEVLGVEFSPAMVELALQEADRRGIAAQFAQADVREFDAAPGSLGAVLFTYDVYSFIPRRRDRVRLLRRMRSWLRPDGVVFLSARRVTSIQPRSILALQWLALQRTVEAEWGDSHTRWIANDGSLRRSFVHLFTTAGLRTEAEQAGFRPARWVEGHGLLVPDPSTMIRA